MGRKKKNTVEAPKEQQKSIGVSYSGTVQIQYCKGNKPYKAVRVHNAGKADLFKYIANCIAGNFNSAQIPKYIHTFNTTRGGLEKWSLVNSTCASNIPFSTVQVKSTGTDENPKYTTEFTFMISYDQIRDVSNVLCLYNVPSFGDNITPLAIIELDQNNSISIGQNNTTNIIITWELAVSNQQI